MLDLLATHRVSRVTLASWHLLGPNHRFHVNADLSE